MNKHVLEVDQVSVKIDDQMIIEKVSLELDRGEMMVVVGPNGAGKTILLKTILGLIKHQEGYIHFHVPKEKIGYVPQRLSFDRTLPLTVAEFMLLEMKERSFFWGRQQSRKLIEKTLAKTHTENLINKQLGSLSGGQLQRVLLAYALIDDPQLLFLDEPFAGIDVVEEQSIYDLIDEVRKECQASILMVSHDLDVVYEYADHVICLNRERLCYGKPKNVLTPETIKKAYGQNAGFFHHGEKRKE